MISPLIKSVGMVVHFRGFVVGRGRKGKSRQRAGQHRQAAGEHAGKAGAEAVGSMRKEVRTWP